MKSLQEIKDEVAKSNGFQSWEDACGYLSDSESEQASVATIEAEGLVDEVAKRCAKEALKNACAVTIHHYFVTHDDKPIERHVLEELINNENNIPELI